MADFTISIVGLGVTGTSLGLALKQASKEVRVVGHDREPAAASAAHKAGAVDRTDWNLINACREASIVILALPLGAIRDTMAAIAPDLAEGCLVTDTAPLKRPVLAWAREVLPPHVHFVGGDPIGVRGRPAAAAELFTGTTYCLCPDSSTPAAAVERASDLAVAVGATPRYLDPAEHDGLVAMLDQLPFLLGAALLRAAAASPSWAELRKLGCGRFDQLLAALGESPAVELELAQANAGNVGRCIDHLQETLSALRELLAGEPAGTEAAAKKLLESRREWESHESEPSMAPPAQQSSGLRRLFWPT